MNWDAILPFVLIFAAFFFLVLRPARKRQQEFAATQRELTPGTEVMLSSGIYGDVVAVDDDTIDLQIAPDVVVTVARQAVGKVIPPGTFDDHHDDNDTDTETSTDH